MPDQTPTPDTALLFQTFNEVGIINQLASAMFEARLPAGFLISHFTVLNHLIRVQDGRTPLDLARAFQVPKTTMTHTLAILERHGLVRLEPNPDDGRSKRVWLTETGRDFRQTAIEQSAPAFAALSARLPMDQIGAMLPLLQELRRVLDAMRM